MPLKRIGSKNLYKAHQCVKYVYVCKGAATDKAAPTNLKLCGGFDLHVAQTHRYLQEARLLVQSIMQAESRLFASYSGSSFLLKCVQES